MNWLRFLGRLLLASALLVGSALSLAPSKPPERVDGYYVLAADFHVHMFPGDEANLSPWDTVLEARRNSLDVIALTGHNHVWTAKLGKSFARHLNGPLVIVSEEIPAPTYHLLAIGIKDTIDWRLSAAEAIAEVHRQGGVAIAAHPVAQLWPAYDGLAIQQLDGSEVIHPRAFSDPIAAADFKKFNARMPLAAIGDSDWHTTGPIGICRTFVFVREVTEQAVLNAIRQRQTVVYDRGQYYGDEKLIQLMRAQGPPAVVDPFVHSESGWTYFSRLAGGGGLFIAILLGPSVFGWRNTTRRS